MQSAARAVDPTRYFENVTTDDDVPEQDPVCLYLETTNRCNLLCTTCPRTYEELEPPADMSWELFTSIVDQVPRLQRAVLHGVGEPMLVKHLHLQRLVFFKENAIGMARPDQALYERLSAEEAVYIERATALAQDLSITFSASGGASEPGVSLKRSDQGSPWSLCRRPWTVMYFTANGRALPYCIAPFSQRGYENYTLGNATQETLREIWTRPAYRAFRSALKSNRPAEACANCGLRCSW